MNPASRIRALYRQAKLQIDPSVDQRIMDTAYDRLDRLTQTRPDTWRLRIWRFMMDSKYGRIAAAAAIIVVALFLARHLTGDPLKAPTPDVREIAAGDTLRDKETPKAPEPLQTELALAEALFAKLDQAGLSALLETGQEETRIAVAGYLGEIGDESVIPALQQLADAWLGSAEGNPFARAIDRIRSRATRAVNDLTNDSATTPALDKSATSVVQGNHQISHSTTYHGIVKNDRGAPISQVRVWGQLLSHEMESSRLEEETHTDDLGQFVLRVRRPSHRPSRAKMFILYFDHPEYGLWAQQVPRSSANGSVDIPMTLFPPEMVVGRVTDADGRPIMGAIVESSIRFRRGKMTRTPMVRRTWNGLAVTTDKEGVFVIERVPRTSRVHLNVHASGYASKTTEDTFDTGTLYTIRAGDEEIQLTLLSGTAVAGRIVTRDGGPYTQGAVLSLDSVESFTRVNASGQFVLEGLAAGKNRVSVRDRSGRRLCADAIIDIDPNRSVSELVFTVHERLPVTIAVNDAESGEPLSNVELRACLDEDMRNYHASGKTNAEGRCQLALHPGAYLLRIGGPENYNLVSADKALTVTTGLVTDVVYVTVATRSSIRGHLIDTEGNPVQGFVKHRPTDSNGFFEIPDSSGQAKSGYFLSVFDVAQQKGNLSFYSASDLQQSLVIVVDDLPSLTGRFLDQEGNPVPEAEVSVMARGPSTKWQLATGPDIDARGVFVIKKVPFGLALELRGGGKHELRDDIEPLEPGEVRDLGDIVIQSIGLLNGNSDWDGTVRGTVTDEEDTPKMGISVQTDINGTHFFTQTDGQGRFSLTGLPTGYPIAVSVYAPGYAFQDKEVFADGENLSLQIFPRGWEVIGKRAPDVHVAKWITGEAFAMEQLLGKVVLIQTGTSVIVQAQRLLQMQKLFDKYHAQGLEIIAFHHPLRPDWPENITESDIRQFIQDNQIRFRFCLDVEAETVRHLHDGPPNLGGAMSALYYADVFGALFLIDKAGTVRVSPTPDNLERWIEQLLEE